MRPMLIILSVLLILGCQTVIPQNQSDPGTTIDGGKKPPKTILPEVIDDSQVSEDPVEQQFTDDGGPKAEPTDAEEDGLSQVQIDIVAAAREVLDTQSTVVGETTYSYDCSGTILTVYAHAGIYLVDLFPNYSGNGVRRLHGIATDYGLIHTDDLPEPGDLVFWDNTYDRNQDGLWNDPLTHAGLVLSVANDGTVEYLHHNYRRGIVTASMNLLKPDTYQSDEGGEKNSPMRMASQRDTNPDLWLSSHLFREFANLHAIQIAMNGTERGPEIASAW